MRTRTACIVVAAIALAGSTAFGQSYRLSEVKIEEGSWHFTPILRVDVTPNRVDSIVALAKVGATSGDNIVAVWYHRGGTDDAAWTATSWMTTSVEEVIKSVKSALSLPDADDELWPVGDKVAMNAIAAPADPTAYYKGVLADDALADLVTTSADRDSVIEVLVAIGYKAADISIEQVAIAQACDSKVVLTAIAKGAEAGLTTVSSDTIVAAMSSYATARCGWWWCWPSTVTAPASAWSACSYGAFGLLPWPATHYDPISGWNHCAYSASCTCTQTQTLTHTYWDCTTATCTQTNTKTCTESNSCNMVAASCSNPPNGECVAQFGSGGSVSCPETGFVPPCSW